MLAAQRTSAAATPLPPASNTAAAVGSDDLATAAAHAGGTGHAVHGAGSAHHCGGVSPCCVGAAIAPALPLAQSGPRLTNKLIPLHAAAPAAVDLATPERPPRRLLA